MSIRRMARAVMLLVGLATTIRCSSEESPKKEGPAIKIGFMTPIVEMPILALRRFKLARLAMKEINDAGGITIQGKSYSLTLVEKDSLGSGEGGIVAANQLVEEGVKFAIGPAWSAEMLGDPEADPPLLGAAEAVAIPRELLLISHSATNTKITDLDDNDLVWRVCPPDQYQAALAAEYFHSATRDTAAVLFRNDAWASGLAHHFRAEFEKRGGTVSDENFVSYEVGGDFDGQTFDYSNLLHDVFRGNPKVIYIVNFHELAKISSDIAVGGHFDSYEERPLLLGTDGLQISFVLANGNPSVLDGMMGTHGGKDESDPNYKKLEKAARNVMDVDLESYDINTYDIVYLFAYAMQKANSLDVSEVKKHLRAVSRDDGGETVINVGEWAKGKAELLAGRDINYEGAGGSIEFTQKGDPGRALLAIWRLDRDASGALQYTDVDTIELTVEDE
jgi:branched-chain amino acid transport system substrate-binding protein